MAGEILDRLRLAETREIGQRGDDHHRGVAELAGDEARALHGNRAHRHIRACERQLGEEALARGIAGGGTRSASRLGVLVQALQMRPFQWSGVTPPPTA